MNKPLEKTERETSKRRTPATDEERIDESVDESFPASDLPAVHPADRAQRR